MKTIITAPFTDSKIEELREAGLDIDYRSWLDTGKLYLGDSFLEIIKEGGFEVAIVEGDEIKEEVIENSELKLIGCVRGSPNNISLPAATAKGIPVIAAIGRNIVAVAELTISLMLSQIRRIVAADRLLRDDFMVDDFGDFAKLYTHSMGQELHGKTVGVIGLGKIGFEVAKRLLAFGVDILVNDPYTPIGRIKEVNGESVTFEKLLRNSDIVTVHCAPTDETKGLLGKEQFSMMKKSAIFINTARASITDEYALLDALKSGTIAGAALDVFSMEPVDCDNIFLELDNVTVSPHIGGNTHETIQRQSEILTRNIKTFLEGGIPDNVLNPEAIEMRSE